MGAYSYRIKVGVGRWIAWKGDVDLISRVPSGWRELTDHASEPFLAGCVPQLQPDLQPVLVDLLRDEKCTGGGCRVLWVEFVLGISL